MPNWCENRVEIRGPLALLEKLQQAFNEGCLFQSIDPQPEALMGQAPFIANNKDDEERKQALISQYGAADWYDWRLAHWGTKWDVDPSDSTSVLNANGCCMYATLMTAWGPPMGIFNTLHMRGYNVKAWWWEPGMMFCGMYINGESHDMDIPASHDLALETLPGGILSKFPILDMLHESEQSQKAEQ